MQQLNECDWFCIEGGGGIPILKNIDVFTRTYVSLAKALTQKEVTVLEATAIYQQLGHCLGEFIYTIVHQKSLNNLAQQSCEDCLFYHNT